MSMSSPSLYTIPQQSKMNSMNQFSQSESQLNFEPQYQMNNNFNSTEQFPTSRNPKKTKQDIISIPETCARCKSSEPEFFCKECYPFSYFCPNCDTHIHSLSSKQAHKRITISDLATSLSTNFQSRNIPPTTQLPDNQMTQSIDYINNIKSLYEKEKNDLMTKSFNLERQLENTKMSLNERISNMHLQLEELQMQKNTEIERLKEKYEFQIKSIISERDTQISELLRRNYELQQTNDQLSFKVKKYLEQMDDERNQTGNSQRTFANEILQLKNDKSDLIKYYETKLQYFNNCYSEDKTGIISSYEDKIEGLKNDYTENKMKLQKLIEQRENDIKEMIEEHRQEVQNLRTEIERIKTEHLAKDREYQDMLTKINQQKFEIEVLKGDIEKVQRKLNFEQKEKKRVESEHEKMVKDNEYLKVTIEKLNRITHGKFKNFV